MRAGLTVAGVEVELRAAAGPIEQLIARRYAPFLGPVVSPVARMRFLPVGRAGGGGRIDLARPDLGLDPAFDGDGFTTVVTDPFGVDDALRETFASVLPGRDGLLLAGAGVITGGRAHVFLGTGGPSCPASALAGLAGTRPLLCDGLVAVRKIDRRWVAAATPFRHDGAPPGPPRQAPLAGVWMPSASSSTAAAPVGAVAAAEALVAHAVPSVSPSAEESELVADIAFDLASSVSCAELGVHDPEAVWPAVEALPAA